MPLDPIREELESLKARSTELGREFQHLLERIEHLESLRETASVEPGSDPTDAVERFTATETDSATPTNPVDDGILPAIPIDTPPVVPPRRRVPTIEHRIAPSVAESDREPAVSFEQLIGQNWLNRIGALVLLLCAFFFVKYAFDQGWLSPAARVMIGALAGVAMIVTGEIYLRKSLRTFAGGLLGCGIGVLYVSAFGAHSFYGLVSTNTAFILYTIVTAISIAVSMHARMQPVAVLAVIGGFATPIALSTNTNQQVALMTYMFVLNAGLLVSAHARRWDTVRGLAWIGTAMLFVGWFTTHYHSSAAWTTVAFLFAFYIQFHLSIIAGLRRGAITNHHAAGLFIQLDNAAFFAGTYLLLRETIPGWLGLFAVIAGATQWFLAWRVCPKDGLNATPNQALWQGGAGMIALAAPIQFDRYLVSIAWAIQSAITFYFCRRSPRGWLRLKGIGVFVAALFHFFLFDVHDGALTKEVAQFGFATFSWIIGLGVVIGIAAYAGAANLMVRRSPSRVDHDLARALVPIGTLLIMGVCAWQLDRYLAGWTWLGLASIWHIISTRQPRVSVIGITIALATLIKFMIFDTCAAAVDDHWLQLSGVLLNRAILTGLLVAGALFWIRHAELDLSGPFARFKFAGTNGKTLFAPIATTLALVTITWTGTFEVVRVLNNEPLNWNIDPRTVISLAVTIFWTVNAAILWATVRDNRPNVARYAFVLILVAAIKYVLFDTLGDALGGQWRELHGLCTNRVFATGLILIAVTSFAYAKLCRHAKTTGSSIFRSANATGMLVAVALLIAWIPTYEIARAFRFEPIRERFTNPSLAMQVAISIYWSFNAAVLVVIGINRHLTALRYIGIAMFGLTVAKVFRFDIWHFATIYRILSCLVLGVLLLFASLQYQRRAMQPKST